MHAAFTASRHHSRRLVCEQMQQHCMVFVCVCGSKWLCTPHCVGRGVQVDVACDCRCCDCVQFMLATGGPWQWPGVLVVLLLLLQPESGSEHRQQQWQREGRPCVLSSCADVIKPVAAGEWLRWKGWGCVLLCLARLSFSCVVVVGVAVAATN